MIPPHRLAMTRLTPPSTVIPNSRQPSVDWIKLLNGEVTRHLEFPLVGTSASLVFLNNPRGEYVWPSAAEIVQPNFGPQGLRKIRGSNSLFILTEIRFCELIVSLKQVTQFDDVIALLERLYEGLGHLHHEKELQWFEQQLGGQVAHGRVQVSTGKSYNSALYAIPC